MATRKAKVDKPDPLSPQQELTAAAVAPAADDAARNALVTIGTQLSEFDKVEAALPELERKYKGVAYPVDTDKGMKDAVEARREIKADRVALEHARKAAKRPIIDLGTLVDGRASKITLRLEAIETPIDDQIKVQERKEAQRKADLERQIADIRATPQQCIGKSVADLELVLQGLDTLPLESFQEYRAEAAKAKLDATFAVQTLYTQAKQAAELAELQERQRKDQARKDGIHQAIAIIGAPLAQLAMCRTSARVQALIQNLEALPIPEAFYEEFSAAAREKKAQVLAELTKARDEKKVTEDARAAVAAAPAPTPAPTPAPVDQPASAQRSGPSSHDAINEEAAQRLMRDFGPVVDRGNSLETEFLRVMRGPTLPEPDPFSASLTSAPAPTGAAISEQRPSDAEILAVLCEHFDAAPATVASWLRAFDAAAALAQQSLIPTT